VTDMNETVRKTTRTSDRLMFTLFALGDAYTCRLRERFFFDIL